MRRNAKSQIFSVCLPCSVRRRTHCQRKGKTLLLKISKDVENEISSSHTVTLKVYLLVSTIRMTNMEENLSIIEFPNELLYRICDYLDTKTMILSFRRVCRNFYRITNNYNRYEIHLNKLSKSELNLFSRIIQAENIFSIHFWSINEQTKYLIELFFSLFDIDQLIRMTLITIWNIEQSHLKKVLSWISKIDHLQSFSIYSSISFNENDQIQNHLNEILSRSSLHHIRLMFDLSSHDQISWHMKSSLETIHLTICNMKQLSSIFNSCANLRQLSLYDCRGNWMEKSFSLNFLRELTHLRFDQMTMSFDQLELILSSTPSLTHLYVRSLKTSLEFLRHLSEWENFLQENLSRLLQLEFYFTCEKFNVNDVQSLIDSFRRPFWLIEKRWTITAEFRCWYQWTELIIYSSLPSAISFPYQCDYKTICCSTSNNDQRSSTKHFQLLEYLSCCKP